MPMLALCLLCALLTGVQLASVAPVGSLEPAENEELTLLFHGALQLGQALNGVYRTMEAQLMEARSSLGIYGHALGLLGQEVSQGRDAAQELRASLLEIQMDGDALKLQTEAMARVLGEVAQGQQELQDSTQQLEVQLRSAWLSHTHQKFEVLKVGGSQPWGSQHPNSHPELASRASPGDIPLPSLRSASQHHGQYPV
ncbi:angiopoietin-like protein 8 isoform X1 [Pteropus vampyrus]|uniref:Angiopoietin-like protein 8 isoform X1 n=1 Tax=Pteropus vampyrus TaxID=132908 RepID=A0A6P6BVQ3_PTEVA|nr:angiopoietin-like protein 8 isoform X1 [Pteropus vampyrus]